MDFPVSQTDFTTNLLLGPRHDTPISHAPQGVKATQFPRGQGGKPPPAPRRGIVWSGTHLFSALLPAVDMHPGPVRGGPPAPRPHSKPPSEQQKSGPEQCKVRKNRLHSRGIWAKIASRRIIRAGREVREHPTPLCRRKRLPHSSKTAPYPLYKDSSPFTRLIL